MPPNVEYRAPLKSKTTGLGERMHFNPDEVIWSQCASCAHDLPVKKKGGIPRCAAFPDGIPTNILHNLVDHQYPISGDSGITYDRRAGCLLPNPFPEPE